MALENLENMTPIERDAYNFEHRFDEAEAVMGKPAADALRRLYDFYGKDWLDWIASLYDPATGAFYYANSSRDNDEFLPDVESTCQAHFIMSFSGLIDAYDGEYVDAYPKAMCENCVEFVRSLQSDVDGYFYHKQWGSDIIPERRGRDLNQSLSLLRRFRGKAPYPTALERLASKGETSERSNMPEHLLSREAMLAYLDKLNLNSASHAFGHNLSSQANQIEAAGFKDLVCEYVHSRQNPETGLWEQTPNYSTLSGVVKVGALLHGLGDYVHHGDKIVDSAMDVIMSDIETKYIIFVFNPWGGFAEAIRGAEIAEREAAERGETSSYSVRSIREKIYARLPELIDKTIEKLSRFRKPDGSFSYEPERSAPTTQGVPVSRGEYEGDVNGLACAMLYPLSSIFGVLGIREIKMCNHDDLLAFRAKIEAAHREYDQRKKEK